MTKLKRHREIGKKWGEILVWWTIARQEWKQAVRSSVLVWFTVLFLLLAAMTLYFGIQAYGGISFQALNKTTSSLLQLSFFFVSIATLILSSLSAAGEWEDRTALLLWNVTSPLAVLVGKWVALTLAMAVSISIGFGFSGLVAGFQGLPNGWILLLLMGILLLLSMVYLSLGLLVGSWTRNRLGAVLASLLIWFFSIVIYPFLSMATVMVVPAFLKPVFSVGLNFLNPADLLRLYSVFKMGGEAAFGSQYYALGKWSQTIWMDVTVIGLVIAWVVGCLWVAVAGWKRKARR